MSAKILIVEDDAQISANIYDYLSAKGMSPDAAPNAAVALHLLGNTSFDLIVLDLGLPGMSGLSLAQQIRQQQGLSLPILILTARDTLDDKQAGFDAGADDYLLKPFSLKELEMRINALLRRASGQVATQVLRFGQISYELKTGQVFWQGRVLKLAPKTISLLHAFLSKPQTLFTREQLERAVWGEVQENSDVLRYHLSQLRKALVLADGGCPIQTVHGRGYMLMAHGEDQMPKMSLRRRISLAFAVLICCSLLALATSILVSSEEREEELIDEIVNTALNQIEARWPVAGQLVLPKNLNFYHAPIGQTPADLPAELAQFGVGNQEYFAQGREYHVGVREFHGSRFYVLYDTSDHEERLKAIYLGVIVAVLLLSALALGLGYFFAGSILRQLSALTLAVEQDLPIEFADVRDREVAILARAISDSREQKAQLLHRERDFTAHVGHELRTPLTRIRNSAELLRELSSLTSTELARVQQIEAAAEQMQARLSSLLFLARDLHAINFTRVNLRQALEASLQHFAEKKTEITRNNDVGAEVCVEADPNLLMILLDNLIGNALRYTQAGHISLSWQRGALCLSDTGEGISEADLPRLLIPFERASELPDGFGLGLAIVKRICDAMAWQCHIQSQVGQGTQIVIQIERVS